MVGALLALDYQQCFLAPIVLVNGAGHIKLSLVQGGPWSGYKDE